MSDKERHDPRTITEEAAPITEEVEAALTQGEGPPEQAAAESEKAEEAPPDKEKSAEERVAELEAKLAEVQAQAEDYLDQWRRTAAEFANYRKRQEREQEEFIKQANANLISKLLPVLDDFDLAFEHLPEDVAKSSWVEGFALIHRKLQNILEQEGVTPIEAVGQPFDPTLHEAVSHEESDEVESGHIIAEVRKGYRMGDKVLRPALVRVAK